MPIAIRFSIPFLLQTSGTISIRWFLSSSRTTLMPHCGRSGWMKSMKSYGRIRGSTGSTGRWPFVANFPWVPLTQKLRRDMAKTTSVWVALRKSKTWLPLTLITPFLRMLLECSSGNDRIYTRINPTETDRSSRACRGRQGIMY